MGKNDRNFIVESEPRSSQIHRNFCGVPGSARIPSGMCNLVGENEFKSEDYLKQKLQEGGRQENLMRAHLQTTVGFICGEIKMALALHLLAGGSYLDLVLLFETGSSYAYAIFHGVLARWINVDSLVEEVADSGNEEVMADSGEDDDDSEWEDGDDDVDEKDDISMKDMDVIDSGDEEVIAEVADSGDEEEVEPWNITIWHGEWHERNNFLNRDVLSFLLE